MTDTASDRVDEGDDSDFTPQEAQERFERALRAALNTPPKHRLSPHPSKKKAVEAAASVSGASAKSGQREA
jgi:hypothetical protein